MISPEMISTHNPIIIRGSFCDNCCEGVTSCHRNQLFDFASCSACRRANAYSLHSKHVMN
jgi:hypothetical protein